MNTATTGIYTLSLHDALPILYPSWAVSLMTMSGSCRYAACCCSLVSKSSYSATSLALTPVRRLKSFTIRVRAKLRSEEHTSELQSQSNLVCRLLLEKKKNKKK